MAKGTVNKVIIIGRLGADPDMRYTAEGNAVANIRVATNEWVPKDRNSGESQEQTEWHKIVAFGKVGEIIGQYLRKGSRVYIEGRIRTQKWQDKNGQDRYTTEIIANNMEMLDGKGSGSNNDSTASYEGRSTADNFQPKSSSASRSPVQNFDDANADSDSYSPPPKPAASRPLRQSPASPPRAAALSDDADENFNDEIPF